MSKIWAAVFVAIVFCTCAPAAPSLEAYGRLPTLSNIAVSPDGKKLAFLKSSASRRAIFIIAAGQAKPLVALEVDDQKLRSLDWADNHRLLITSSVTEDRSEWSAVTWFDVDKKEFHRLFDHAPEGSMNAALRAPEVRIIDGHTVIFVTGYIYGYAALFRMDLDTGVTRTVDFGRETVGYDWALDKDGNILAVADYRNDKKHWKLKLLRDGHGTDPGTATTVMDVDAPIDTPEIEGLSEDGSAVVLLVPKGTGSAEYEQVSLKDGTISPWQHSDMNLSAILTNARSGRVEGGSKTFARTEYAFLDPQAEMTWNIIKGSFLGATDLQLVARSDDWNTVVARVFGPAHGDRYVVVDMTSHNALPVGPAYDGIDEIAPVKWIDYRAGDGRTIHAYLTMPLNGKTANLPLIVLPHGGPHSRDEPGFDWISQALASRGYAVLQPQFRGSNGFGPELLAAGYGEFGRKMQTDLSDGVRALAAQGLIDPKRVCIVGFSYGGYAALAGATLDTGIYRCAVSVAGISDLKADLSDMHWSSNPGARFWDRFLGVEGPSDPKLNAITPIKHVDKVTIPILLIHGLDDTVVKFSQSEDMADALKAAKKPYEFVILKGEDHWMSKGDTRLQMLTATVKFLEANNPPN